MSRKRITAVASQGQSIKNAKRRGAVQLNHARQARSKQNQRASRRSEVTVWPGFWMGRIGVWTAAGLAREPFLLIFDSSCLRTENMQ
jgi:hypothetical protein